MKHDQYQIIERADLFMPEATTHANERIVIQIDLPLGDDKVYYSVFYDRVTYDGKKAWQLDLIKEGKVEK